MTAAVDAELAAVPTQRTAPDPHMADLVHRAQAGDTEAFGRIYHHYRDLVFRYIRYRIGNTATAEEYTHDVFLRALRRISAFRWQGREFGAWLITIARNLVADHFKSARHHREWLIDDFLGPDGDRLVAHSADVEVLAADTSKAMLAALDQLTPEQRDCLLLRFYAGLTLDQTATAMGKNAGAIKALQYRATQTLAKVAPHLEAHR